MKLPGGPTFRLLRSRRPRACGTKQRGRIAGIGGAACRHRRSDRRRHHLRQDRQGPVRDRLARRRRTKAHLSFVAAQPCLVCQRTPCDAHHLKFAEPRARGRKVSDEFTVPLCREHHRQLRHHGNEIAWWANVQIAPLGVAKSLWDETKGRIAAHVAQQLAPRFDEQAE
jgi:hypothetical protein